MPKPRKARTVYDGLIDIHDVSTECGENYVNWIPIVHSKLNCREWQLFTQKCNKIIEVTNEVS